MRLVLIRDEQSRDEAKHMAPLRAISEKIDKVQAALPQSIDPQLGNYLQRRSYDKALEFLEQLLRRLCQAPKPGQQVHRTSVSANF